MVTETLPDAALLIVAPLKLSPSIGAARAIKTDVRHGIHNCSAFYDDTVADGTVANVSTAPRLAQNATTSHGGVNSGGNASRASAERRQDCGKDFRGATIARGRICRRA
jgi:hypothetical protein